MCVSGYRHHLKKHLFILFFFCCLGSQWWRVGHRCVLLWPTVSLVVVGGLSCSAVCGILFPGSGIETGSPSRDPLQGGFLTTGPPGKSCRHHSELKAKAENKDYRKKKYNDYRKRNRPTVESDLFFPLTQLKKVSFHSNLKERQCQRMFKLPYNCAHFTY